MSVQDTEIKLVDSRGRTVFSFVKRAYFDDGVWSSDDWGIAVKPRSQKMLAHERRQPTQSPDRYLKYLPDEDRYVLELPGLTLRWEKVTRVLDKLAEHGWKKLTVDQLRGCVGS